MFLFGGLGHGQKIQPRVSHVKPCQAADFATHGNRSTCSKVTETPGIEESIEWRDRRWLGGWVCVYPRPLTVKPLERGGGQKGKLPFTCCPKFSGCGVICVLFTFVFEADKKNRSLNGGTDLKC